MTVFDITDDLGAEIRLAENIGRGLGNVITGFQRNKRNRELLKQNKVIDQTAQQETLRIVNSGKTPQEMLSMFNEMPEAVQTRARERFAEDQKERALLEKPRAAKLKEMQNAQSIVKQFTKFDTQTQEFTVQPGFENIVKNATRRINEISADLFPQPAQPAPQPDIPDIPIVSMRERLAQFPQDVDRPGSIRNFGDDIISEDNAKKAIKEHAKELIDSGKVDPTRAQEIAITEYNTLLERDKQGIRRKYPDINTAVLFDKTPKAETIQRKPGESITEYLKRTR